MANYIPASVSSLKNYENFQDFYSDQNLFRHQGAACHRGKATLFQQNPDIETEKSFVDRGQILKNKWRI